MNLQGSNISFHTDPSGSPSDGQNVFVMPPLDKEVQTMFFNRSCGRDTTRKTEGR